jgi:hypothetical protein
MSKYQNYKVNTEENPILVISTGNLLVFTSFKNEYIITVLSLLNVLFYQFIKLHAVFFPFF